MPRPGQKTVTLSDELYAEIERLVRENRELFESPSQFVKHAVAELALKTRAAQK